jgi:hypothetical protein
VGIAPGEYNQSGQFVDHLKPRGNYQGYEHFLSFYLHTSNFFDFLSKKGNFLQKYI